jgi:hypothetical protein
MNRILGTRERNTRSVQSGIGVVHLRAAVKTFSKDLPMRLCEEPLRADQEHERVATAIEEVRSSLQGTFHGDLLGPADPAYADARVIWNGMVARCWRIVARDRKGIRGCLGHVAQNRARAYQKARRGFWNGQRGRDPCLSEPNCASSLLKTDWKRCGLNRGQRSTGGWLRYVRHLGCTCVSTVDRMSQTAAVEDEETVISNTDLGSSVVAVMQSAQASPRDHPSAPD